MIKKGEAKVRLSIRLILFRHGLHGFHGFNAMIMQSNRVYPCNPCLNQSYKVLFTHLISYFRTILLLAPYSFRFSGEDSQFEDCKDDFCCGVPGKCVFQIFIFEEVFEINGWSAIVEIKKKIGGVVIDAKVGKFVQDGGVENRRLACF